MQMSGIVTGTESMRVSVTNLLSEYMRITERIDEILIEIEQLKKDNKTNSGNECLKQQVEALIKERKKLRSDLNTNMDKLEKQVETIGSTVEDTKKEAAKTNEDLVSFKSNMTEALIKQKDDLQNIISKLEKSHKKELQALETRLQTKQKEDLQNIVSKLEENHKKELQASEQRVQELVQKDRKDHSEEISSLSRRINLNRLELLQQFHTQDKYQIRAPLRRHSDYHKRCSLPVPLQLGEDELTKSLPPTFPRQRHISEASSQSDSGYSQISAITPEKEGSFEFVSQRPRRPPSAQSYFPGGLQERVQTSVPFPGGLQERVPTPMPKKRQRPRSLTVPIQIPQFH